MSCEMQKMQEMILIKDDKRDSKLWKEIEEDYSLEYHLDKFTKDELVKLGSKYEVKGLTSLKKAQIIEKLIVNLDRGISKNIEVLDYQTILYLEKFITDSKKKLYNEDEFIIVNFLRDRGIIFTGSINKENVVLITDEVKEILKKYIGEDIKRKAKDNEKLLKIVAGMSYYYGCIELSEVKKLINNEIKEDIFETIIKNGTDLGYDYQVENGILINIDVQDSDAIMNKQKEVDLPYCKFDQGVLIKASQNGFIEYTKQGANIERVIGELFVVDKKIIQEELEDFVIAIKNEEEIENVIEYFLLAYEIESDEEKEIFKIELTKLANTVSRWGLKGYSINEVEKKLNKVIKEEKIGRNDPCLCGSGKKYKKCCGK